MSNEVITEVTHTNNGVALGFKLDTIRKGTNAGNPIYRPQLEALTLTVSGTLADYLGGADKVQKLLVRQIQQNAAAASREALENG